MCLHFELSISNFLLPNFIMAGLGMSDMNASGGSAKPQRSRSPPGDAEAKKGKAEADAVKKASDDRLNKAFEENFAKFEPILMGNVKDLCKGAVIGELQIVNDKIDYQGKRLDAMDLKLNDQQEALKKLQEGMTTLLSGNGNGAGNAPPWAQPECPGPCLRWPGPCFFGPIFLPKY